MLQRESPYLEDLRKVRANPSAEILNNSPCPASAGLGFKIFRGDVLPCYRFKYEPVSGTFGCDNELVLSEVVHDLTHEYDPLQEYVFAAPLHARDLEALRGRERREPIYDRLHGVNPEPDPLYLLLSEYRQAQRNRGKGRDRTTHAYDCIARLAWQPG